VLSDVHNEVARRYGLVLSLAQTPRPVSADLPSYNGDDSWELPMPGTFVIAPEGTVRLAIVDIDWTMRLEPVAVLDTLRRLASR
jgi:peroxiredoxin